MIFKIFIKITSKNYFLPLDTLMPTKYFGSQSNEIT